MGVRRGVGARPSWLGGTARSPSSPSSRRSAPSRSWRCTPRLGVRHGLSPSTRSRRRSPTSRCTPGCPGRSRRCAPPAPCLRPDGRWVKAAGLVLTAPRRFELRRFDLPDVDDDHGLLRVEACGLCGTDHEQYTGPHPVPPRLHPRPRGDRHHRAGRLHGRPQRWGVERGPAGRRRGVPVVSRVRPPAARASTVVAPATAWPTMVGFVDVDRPPGLWGGYATHLYLGPGLDAAAGARRARSGAGDDVQPARRRHPLGRRPAAAPQPGDVVAVLGPGVRGLCAAAAASDAGAGFVMITGTGSATPTVSLAPPPSVPTWRSTSAVDDPVARAARRDRRPGRRRRRRHGEGAGWRSPRPSRSPAPAARSSSPAPGASPRRPGSTPTTSSTRSCACSARSASTSPPTARRSTCWPAGRYPFAELPREVVGFAGLEALVQRMAGEGDGTPPVHAVFAPEEEP